MADSSTGSHTAALKGEAGMKDKGNGARMQEVGVAGYCRIVLARTVRWMLDREGRGMRTMVMSPGSYERRSPSHWC